MAKVLLWQNAKIFFVTTNPSKIQMQRNTWVVESVKSPTDGGGVAERNFEDLRRNSAWEFGLLAPNSNYVRDR
jgi:hypothetical protein